jgi:hypothetical protein
MPEELKLTVNPRTLKKSGTNPILYALRTTPVEPEQARLVFTAEGVPPPIADDSCRAHWVVCRKKGVVPHSTLALEYRPPAEHEHLTVLLPADYQHHMLRTPSHTHPHNLIEMEQRLLLGGRFYTLSVAIQTGEFAQFKLLDLKTILDAGYAPTEGELLVRGRHTSSPTYFSGYRGDTTWGFSGNQLTLEIGSRVSNEEAVALRGWFNRLREKYAPKVTA